MTDIDPLEEFGIRKDEDIWVFGYGSLMWDPGFDYDEHALAYLRGYHRRFCLQSVIYCGTPDKPGLVLGLDLGGSCRGMAFHVPASGVRVAMDYLWGREMACGGEYVPKKVQVTVAGKPVSACTFVVNRNFPHYHTGRCLDEQAEIIAAASGKSGPNIRYIANTVEKLQELGIRDRAMEDLLSRVELRYTAFQTGG